ncbi:ferredoxin [Pleomassaria siparia CBS 279.74]|uniref:Ferredoxin n=1 Tax=Pleomassaria siparia CBS 279.74 TaxID=1314801 RepID=A0A6G1JZV0_9PLEO|nr:ferredoxin [Pleomassaria siparia CBS 279.74]
MVGAGAQERALFRALSRSSFISSSSSCTPRRQASARIHRFHTSSRNWLPFVPTRCIPAITNPSLLSCQSSSTRFVAPEASVRHLRAFSSTHIARHNHLDPPKPGEERSITFIEKDGTSLEFKVADGDNLLDIAVENDLDVEGACGGSCACSTCHVIVVSDHYDVMEEPDDDENDMLDQAFGLTETSRLGCQVKMTKELDGLVVKLPSMTKNLQASDFETK